MSARPIRTVSLRTLWLEAIVEWEGGRRDQPCSVAGAQAVALQHYLHANSDGSNVFVSARRIEEKTSIHRDTVSALRRRWVATGWMTDTGERRGRAAVLFLSIPPADDEGVTENPQEGVTVCQEAGDWQPEGSQEAASAQGIGEAMGEGIGEAPSKGHRRASEADSSDSPATAGQTLASLEVAPDKGHPVAPDKGHTGSGGPMGGPYSGPYLWDSELRRAETSRGAGAPPRDGSLRSPQQPLRGQQEKLPREEQGTAPEQSSNGHRMDAADSRTSERLLLRRRRQRLDELWEMAKGIGRAWNESAIGPRVEAGPEYVRTGLVNAELRGDRAEEVEVRILGLLESPDENRAGKRDGEHESLWEWYRRLAGEWLYSSDDDRFPEWAA